jgi:hypothetical protein
MNKYEMIKDMCPDYGTMCDKCNLNGSCPVEYIAESLINKNYHKIPEGSVVLTKEEYEALLLEQKRLKEMVDRIPCGYVQKEEVDYWKNRCKEIGDVASKETAREIIDILLKEFSKRKSCGNADVVVRELANKLGVEV